MRTMGSNKAVLAAAALIAFSVLGGCGDSSTSDGAATVDMSFTHADTVDDLYRSSDVLLDVTLMSGPEYTPTDANAGAYPGASSDTPQTVPLLTKYAIYEARINKVLGNRPGEGVDDAGRTVKVGFNVINPDLEESHLANLEELKSSGFPQVGDLPPATSRVIIFATPMALGSLGNGYEAISYASSGGARYVIHFSPGKIRGATVDSADLTPAAAAAQFGRKKNG